MYICKNKLNMIDWNQATVDYAECYADKSRIKFIEKYLHTFDATRGKKMPEHVGHLV